MGKEKVTVDPALPEETETIDPRKLGEGLDEDGLFTAEFLNFWREYAGSLQNQLRLCGFRVLLDAEPIQDDDGPSYQTRDDTPAACIRVIPNRVTAVLKLSADWASYPPAQQRLYLTHELVHLITNPAYEIAESMLDGLDIDQTRLLLKALYNEVERETDFVATVIAPFFPLPETGTEVESVDLEIIPAEHDPPPSPKIDIDKEKVLG